MNARNKCCLVGAVGLAVTALTTGAAVADDLNPADFRGDPTSVFAHWDFRSSSDPFVGFGFGPDPDGPSGPITPNTEVEPGYEIFTPDPEHPFTTYRFTIPNWIDELELKCMRIQVTYTEFFQTVPNFLNASIRNITAMDNGLPVPPGNITQKFVTTPATLNQTPTSITSYFYEDWQIEPNPDSETFDIDLPNGVQLDQIVVDTVSLPEPASIALLGLGLALARRRKRA